MSRADTYRFSDEERGLSSFVTLVQWLQGFDEPETDSGWASYLTCVSVMPGAGPKPTHPLYLPLGFPADGPPKPLPQETAKSIERRFATLRRLRKQLAASMSQSGKPAVAVVRRLGPQAMAAIRGLGADLEATRFWCGEVYVVGLKMRQALADRRIGNARLVQILDGTEVLWESYNPGAGRLTVEVDRLVYRLPQDAAVGRAACDNIRERIEKTYTRLFPGHHAVIEIRDGDAATLDRGRVVGPTYQETKRKHDHLMKKLKES